MRNTNQLFIGDEYQIRFGIWLTNKRLTQEHNSASKGFKVGLNRFAALTPSEYRSFLGLKIDLKTRPAEKSNLKIPAIVDWRDQGVVNPIQDQLSCGSCWAFSAIQSIESIYAIKYGVPSLYKLSEQNIVDCDTNDRGCDGGLMTTSFDYIISHQHGAVSLLHDYPYTASESTCKYDSSKAVTVLHSYIKISQGNENDLAEKVANYGPCAIAIDASNWSFEFYTEGVYDEPYCSASKLDHGVGCIGYGIEGGVDYWLIRNSWGTGWGEGGYIRMIRNKNNQCGEATIASVAVAP